jgi:hypothetical protein
MWTLRLAYYLGADPAELAHRYYKPRQEAAEEPEEPQPEPHPQQSEEPDRPDWLLGKYSQNSRPE